MTNQSGSHSDIEAEAYEETLSRLRGVRLFSQRLTQAQSVALISMEADEVGTFEICNIR